MITGFGHLNTGSQGEKLWKLTIFGNSGRTKLEALSGGIGSDNYQDVSFYCNQDVFVITQPTWTDSGKDWEKSIANVELTLDKCVTKEDGKGECELKISDNVGLAWNPSFNAKVTLLD